MANASLAVSRSQFSVAWDCLDKTVGLACHVGEGSAERQVRLGGDRFTDESVQALYQKHGAELAAYACSRGLDLASAQDMVQQVFLKLLEGRVLPDRAPLAYLYRAVRNASLNLRRDRGQEVGLADEELWLAHETADRTEILSVQDALRELPEEQRETVFLKIWSGLTLHEIADATGTSLNTVASRYRYALGKLRERLVASPRVKE
jgi:RNA polymerase sigma factor (sigma-70 family)